MDCVSETVTAMKLPRRQFMKVITAATISPAINTILAPKAFADGGLALAAAALQVYAAMRKSGTPNYSYLQMSAILERLKIISTQLTSISTELRTIRKILLNISEQSSPRNTWNDFLSNHITLSEDIRAIDINMKNGDVKANKRVFKRLHEGWETLRKQRNKLITAHNVYDYDGILHLCMAQYYESFILSYLLGQDAHDFGAGITQGEAESATTTYIEYFNQQLSKEPPSAFMTHLETARASYDRTISEINRKQWALFAELEFGKNTKYTYRFLSCNEKNIEDGWDPGRYRRQQPLLQPLDPPSVIPARIDSYRDGGPVYRTETTLYETEFSTINIDSIGVLAEPPERLAQFQLTETKVKSRHPSPDKETNFEHVRFKECAKRPDREKFNAQYIIKNKEIIREDVDKLNSVALQLSGLVWMFHAAQEARSELKCRHAIIKGEGACPVEQ